jgi:hypothetical protein
VRDLCLALVDALLHEPDDATIAECIRCYQQFAMLSAEQVSYDVIVPFLQKQLTSRADGIRHAAINCIYQLIQRDPAVVMKYASNSFIQDLFASLDMEPAFDGTRDVILSLLKQSGLTQPSYWVSLCVSTLSKQQQPQGKPYEAAAVADTGEEEETIVLATTTRESRTSQWKTQLFSLQCLRQLISLAAAIGSPLHLDLIAAKQENDAAKDYLVYSVGELIRIGFTAATSAVNDIRLEGLHLMHEILSSFAAAEDAEFEGSSLLEQYQAQITSALTPAFGAGSSAQVVALGVRVCGFYVGCGVVKDLSTLGRVLKLLIAALERCKEEDALSQVGEMKDFSPHASAMVKLAVLTAWAELYSASLEHDYLVPVVQTNLEPLCKLWLIGLQDYARVRVDTESNLGANLLERMRLFSGLNSMYAQSTKSFVLPYYETSWTPILRAVGDLAEKRFTALVLALQDDKENAYSGLYLLIGLCLHSLSSTSIRAAGVETKKICLHALRAFLHPDFSGPVFLNDALFIELFAVLDRLVQTENDKIRVDALDIMKRIAESYPSNYLFSEGKSVQCLRMLLHAMAVRVPSLVDPYIFAGMSGRDVMDTASVRVVELCFELLRLLYVHCPVDQQVQLLVAILGIYSATIAFTQNPSVTSAVALAHLKALMDTLSEDKLPIVQSFLYTLNKSCSDERTLATAVPHVLLANVVVLSHQPLAFQHAQTEREFVQTIARELTSTDQKIMIGALQCIRSLCMLSNKDDVVLARTSRRLSQQLVPHLAVYIQHIHQIVQSLDGDLRRALVDEVVRVLTAILAAAPAHTKKDAFVLVLSLLGHMLDKLGPLGILVLYQGVGQAFVEQATHHATDLKGALIEIDVRTKTLVEAGIRQSLTT